MLKGAQTDLTDGDLEQIGRVLFECRKFHFDLVIANAVLAP